MSPMSPMSLSFLKRQGAETCPGDIGDIGDTAFGDIGDIRDIGDIAFGDIGDIGSILILEMLRLFFISPLMRVLICLSV